MSTTPLTMHLIPDGFSESERQILEWGTLRASGFRFDTGVCGLRLASNLGHAVVLPWQGQQIWSAHFLGRDLGMVSTVSRPRPTRQFLDTYGAFFLHCGALAMGVPGPQDTHPQHGELPNAPFDGACLIAADDELGPYLAITGTYRHTVAFVADYSATATIRIRPHSSVLDISLEVTNHRHEPMPWMYLAHINFRPVNGSRLVYTAPCSPERVRVRQNVPPHVTVPPGYREFLAALASDPSLHNTFSTDQPYTPEVCLYLDYVADRAGWAHSLQQLPDGTADYAAHRPLQLPKAIRWIANNGNEAAMGMVLPATAEPEGFTAEKAKGHVGELAAGASKRVELRIGALNPTEAREVTSTIAATLA